MRSLKTSAGSSQGPYRNSKIAPYLVPLAASGARVILGAGPTPCAMLHTWLVRISPEIGGPVDPATRARLHEARLGGSRLLTRAGRAIIIAKTKLAEASCTGKDSGCACTF